MKSYFLNKIIFKRIISTGKFIPEIDGLRFIAISSVVLYHITAFILDKSSYKLQDISDSFIINIILNGDYGVPLFFVISGFILGLPFAKTHIYNSKKIDLKKFYLRRLTRLEPPYILVMFILFLGSVFIAKNLSLKEATISFLSSLIYSHNLIYGVSTLLNAVAWSLEIEIQFYILTPLLTYVFFVKSIFLRRIFIISLIIFFLLLNNFNFLDFGFVFLLNYIHYFLLGYLLSDLYLSKSFIIPKTKLDSFFCCFFLIVIWIYDLNDFNYNVQKFLWESFQLISMFFIFYFILFHKTLKLFSNPIITNIGGMCYSIYLLHYPIISLFGNKLIKLNYSYNLYFDLLFYTIILSIIILTISSIFYLTIERPCMDKNWIKKVFR